MSNNNMLHGPNSRYQAIDADLFIQNRKRLIEKLLPHSLVVLHSQDIMPTSGDGVLPFVQDSDFFYLCGIDQEESILLFCPEGTSYKAVLFIKETTPEIAIWEGAKYTHEKAFQASGIEEIHPLSAFKKYFHRCAADAEYIYLNSNEHTRAEVEVETRNRRFLQQCKQEYPLHSYKRLAPLMKQLRMVKSEREIALIRKACTITRDGFLKALPCIRPHMREYEIEAIFAEHFTRSGSNGFAYTPIIASGRNSCVLHYIANNQLCQVGDLILLDIGADYAGYKSDMTRVVPASGRFTDRQKQVYQAVLDTLVSAKKLLMPGVSLSKYQTQIGQIIEKHLVDLGLLTLSEIQAQDPKQPAYKRYFMHGTSHHLGLDTHDLADMNAPLQEGMVLTVEPGIYILEENLGIRLENDVVIRKEGTEDLMHDIPLTLEEIESHMS